MQVTLQTKTKKLGNEKTTQLQKVTPKIGAQTTSTTQQDKLERRIGLTCFLARSRTPGVVTVSHSFQSNCKKLPTVENRRSEQL